MKTKHLFLIACAAAASLCAMPLPTQEHANPSTQREKFAACAHDSKGLKGDERREFMSDCLKKHPNGAAAASREVLGEAAGQGRLAPCNAEADRRKLHGDERRGFLDACLKS